MWGNPSHEFLARQTVSLYLGATTSLAFPDLPLTGYLVTAAREETNSLSKQNPMTILQMLDPTQG